MDTVTITVKRKGEAQLHDMQLPVDVPAVQLAEAVALALNWRTSDGRLGVYELELFLPGSEQGRRLNLGETLQQVGGWDGSWLVFHQSHAVPPPPSAAPVTKPQPIPATTETSPIVKGWRQI